MNLSQLRARTTEHYTCYLRHTHVLAYFFCNLLLHIRFFYWLSLRRAKTHKAGSKQRTIQPPSFWHPPKTPCKSIGPFTSSQIDHSNNTASFAYILHASPRKQKEGPKPRGVLTEARKTQFYLESLIFTNSCKICGRDVAIEDFNSTIESLDKRQPR